jgi:hypothetical protein
MRAQLKKKEELDVLANEIGISSGGISSFTKRLGRVTDQ